MAFMRFSPDPPHEFWLEKHRCPYKRRKGIQGGGTAPCIPRLSLHVQRIAPCLTTVCRSPVTMVDRVLARSTPRELCGQQRGKDP